MKYIMLQREDKFFPIVFPNHKDFNHDFVAEAIEGLRSGYPEQWERKFVFDGEDVKVVSAGFVTFGPSGAFCYGRSETLDLDSRPEDTAIIQNQN